MTRSWAAVAATTIGLALLPAAASAASRTCVPGDAATAGVALFGAGTEVARFDEVDGLRTALVLEPYIAPGTRHRMIAIAGGWCDAETAFNQAWAANGLPVGNGARMAAAYARLAAAPYFDETTITSQRSVAGAHVLVTHARTNGVVAAWTVVTDGAGVRTARWTATDYAVKPFVAQWEGITAVDGVSEGYVRGAQGRLEAAAGLPTPTSLAGAAPGPELSYTAPDGFKVVIAISDTRNAPDVGQDVGNYRADLLRITRDAIAENYKDFYDWGFRGNWTTAKTRPVLLNSPAQIPAPPKTGYVSINDGTSAACQACVFIADDFQIHIISEVNEFLKALGYSYPGASDRDILSDILGHELFHNFQNNYTRPPVRSVPTSYSEGTARFQETLHAYSAISDQPSSLVYANDANGCNGLAGTPPDTALAAGAFETPLYSACNFWMGWYGAEGHEALTRLVTSGIVYDTQKTDWTNSSKVISGIEEATGKPYTTSAAEWATALITKKNLTWGDPLGRLAPRDWGKHLERWNPVSLDVGGSASRTLANGGVMANRVTGGAFRPSITTGAKLAVLRDSAAGTALSYPANGELVPAAADGETVYVIGVRPVKGQLSTKITLAQP